MRPERITIYDDGTVDALDTAAVVRYVEEQTGCSNVRARGSFLLQYGGSEVPNLAASIARLKVRTASAPPAAAEPVAAEVDFERRRLEKADRGPFGILYDGFGLQTLMRELLPTAERRLSRVHIAFTNRLVASWSEDDRRYHLRTIILGLPAIISTTGLVEAPAKPREFYVARQQLARSASVELAHALLKARFEGQFLDHNDPRLTEVAKGYAMQAVLYQAAGEAFCPDPDCRLFNAHWQAELVRAQVTSGQYCPRHAAVLQEMRQEPQGAPSPVD